MATRSNIAIENEDGTVKSIYCHFDGYPEGGVGTTLFHHYQDREKVESLIALGSLSYLAARVSPHSPDGHSFDGNREDGVTLAYHRDRGEDLHIESHDSKEAFFKSDYEEFGYLYTKEGKWVMVSYDTSPTPLGKVLGLEDEVKEKEAQDVYALLIQSPDDLTVRVLSDQNEAIEKYQEASNECIFEERITLIKTTLGTEFGFGTRGDVFGGEVMVEKFSE